MKVKVEVEVEVEVEAEASPGRRAAVRLVRGPVTGPTARHRQGESQANRAAPLRRLGTVGGGRMSGPPRMLRTARGRQGRTSRDPRG